jgi:hypothetical protein
MSKLNLMVFAMMLAVAAPAGAAEYNLYFGNLHAHTSYSDGQLTPADAFPYARDTGGLHFMAMTDHVEQITGDDWPNTKAAADAATADGTFVALVGYEWGSPVYNHLNFFDIEVLYGIDAYVVADIGDLWRQIRATEPPPIMQFNHPDWNPDAPKHNWKQFKYEDDIDAVASLIEFQDTEHEKAYILALDMGWHVSPVWNQDNHDPDWGTANEHRAALWAETLSRAGLLEAMRAGRSYATADKNAEAEFKGNGAWMGSVVNARPVKLEWTLFDPDEGDVFSKVEIVTSGGTVVHSYEAGTALVGGTFDADPGAAATAWYYLRATMSDGAMIYTAPIYYVEAPDAGTPDSGADAGGEADGGVSSDVLLTGSEPTEEAAACSCATLSVD